MSGLGWGGVCLSSAYDSVRDLFNVPTLVERAEERIQRTLSVTLGALEALARQLRQAKDAPALATLTVLCERRSGWNPTGDKDAAEPAGGWWVPSVLGQEVWLSPNQSYDMILMPQVSIRNLRWFVSGSPEIVCQGLVVAGEASNAAWGGTKFGDWQGEVKIGTNIRARLERKAVPS